MSSIASPPTAVELLTIAGSRLLGDGKVVFAGVGAPLEASVLAKRLHAPALTIVLEGGSIGPRMLPGRLPVSTNEMRAAHGAGAVQRPPHRLRSTPVLEIRPEILRRPVRLAAASGRPPHVENRQLPARPH